jgi:hypothetical protein
MSELLSLKKAARRLARNGRKPSSAVLVRWILSGKLQGVRRNGKLYVRLDHRRTAA